MIYMIYPASEVCLKHGNAILPGDHLFQAGPDPLPCPECVTGAFLEVLERAHVSADFRLPEPEIKPVSFRTRRYQKIVVEYAMEDGTRGRCLMWKHLV